ncbi:MAG: A/G-specific adenine glycosylase [Alphaproteobacteria bacterium]|nr:A/G-specific adenine glycosylase [Alphaproteobacteria bacterium]
MPSPKTPRPKTEPAPHPAVTALLAWYDVYRRVLPWRARPGESADPYRVWLSEIMLQQTTVAAVKAYFQRFTGMWPTVHDLAAAPIEDVMQAWAGLGYYSRARNLHAAAQAVAAAGAFPDTEDALRDLPGVGPYTAAAIAAIAFGRKATPLDANIERVMARLYAIETPLPQAKPELKARAAALTPDRRAGDFAQALMDLGATICTPKSPSCLMCPLQAWCAARKAGIAETLPRKAAKPDRPTRTGAAFVLVSARGNVLLRRRPPKGLLGGMLELPTTPWQPDPSADPLAHAPASAAWRKAGRIEHGFTHFLLTLDVYTADTSTESAEGHWVPLDKAPHAGLPTVMRKVLEAGLSAIPHPPTAARRPRSS